MQSRFTDYTAMVNKHMVANLENWEKGTEITESTRYLGVVMPRKAPTEADCARFAILLDQLVANGLIQQKKLCGVVSLELKDDQNALMLYTYSNRSKDEINASLKMDLCYDEGVIPPLHWG